MKEKNKMMIEVKDRKNKNQLVKNVSINFAYLKKYTRNCVPKYNMQNIVFFVNLVTKVM